MIPRRRAALLAAVGGVLLACEDVPLAPKWDADWYLPVSSQPIRLQDKFGPITIPPGAPPITAADTTQQGLDESVGSVLERDITSAGLIVTLSKTPSLPFALSDTVIVAGSQADLSNAAAPRIVVPVGVASTDGTVTDTTVVSSAAIAMLRTTAESGGTLFIEVRGRIQFTGTSPYTVQASDTIGVKLAMLARIGVSTTGN
jgi:hypothetical protein